MENTEKINIIGKYGDRTRLLDWRKPSLGTRIKNAYTMLEVQGLGPFLYKIRRLAYRKVTNLARKIYPYAGKRLRERAMEYTETKGFPFKLSIVISMLGQHDMTQFCLNKVIEHHKEDLEILIVDNGGDFTPEIPSKSGGPFTLRVIIPPGGNLGVYPVYKFGMENTTGDIVLFIHNDLMIDEDGFDIFVKYLFATKDKLGLLGFVGSDEINEHGGKGYGTTSNFEAKTYTYKDKSWTGGDALIYGSRYDGFTNAVILDGLAMAFRRKAYEKIDYRPKFPPNHFHDRLVPCQILEAGYTVGVLGIACDHMDAQTRTNEKKYQSIVQGWCEKNNTQKFMDDSGNVSWEYTIHFEAQRQFLKEWRDQKHFIPRKVRQWL